MMNWDITTCLALVALTIVTCENKTSDINANNDLLRLDDEGDEMSSASPKEGDVFTDLEAENIDEVEIEKTAMVATEHGPVVGFKVHADLEINSYFDIPYGKFQLFQDPTMPDAWEVVHEVQTHVKHCPQVQQTDAQFTGDLDCLTVSVFTPSEDTETPRSVLFHIHDTDFATGHANPTVYGPEHLVPNDVVLVLPNYRLGPLGFLCLQNETAPGNAALKDLTLALKWTFNNIGYFGGDPTNIVVSGIGNAGALAGYLAISPTSRDYVSRVITDSGSVLSAEVFNRDPLSEAENLAQFIRKATGVHDSNTFHDIDATLVSVAAKDMKFRPCLEKESDAGNFMTETPWQMLQNINGTLSFMMGSSNHAGMQDARKHTALSLAQINENYEILLPKDLIFESCVERGESAKILKTLYFDGDAIGLDFEKLSLYYTDAVYLSPGIRTARALVEHSISVYYYEFGFVGDFNRELISLGSPFGGAARGDLAGYVFKQDGEMPAVDSREASTIHHMVKLWTSFIKTGIPVTDDIEWKKLSFEETENILFIGDEIAHVEGLHQDRLLLLTELYQDHFVERNSARKFAALGVITTITIQACVWMEL